MAADAYVTDNVHDVVEVVANHEFRARFNAAKFGTATYVHVHKAGEQCRTVPLRTVCFIVQGVTDG